MCNSVWLLEVYFGLNQSLLILNFQASILSKILQNRFSIFLYFFHCKISLWLNMVWRGSKNCLGQNFCNLLCDGVKGAWYILSIFRAYNKEIYIWWFFKHKIWGKSWLIICIPEVHFGIPSTSLIFYSIF